MTELDLRALPRGTTSEGWLTPDVGHPVAIPYLVARGRHEGPTLLVTAGVHGAEYASIEAAYRAARTDPDALTGDLIVLPVVDTAGFFARSIYVSGVDGKNLNRAFPGRSDGSYTDRLALWLTDQMIARADAYVDLHGGDMIESLVPFAIHAADHEPSRALAEAFGLTNVIASGGTGMTYSAGSARGVPSVLAEAGGQGRWPESAVEPLTTGVTRVMRSLGMLTGEIEPVRVRTLDTFDWLRAEATGLWHPAVTAGDEVAAGQEVGRVTDLLGADLQRAVSSVDGLVLFAVESLAITQRDPLVGIGA